MARGGESCRAEICRRRAGMGVVGAAKRIVSEKSAVGDGGGGGAIDPIRPSFANTGEAGRGEARRCQGEVNNGTRTEKWASSVSRVPTVPSKRVCGGAFVRPRRAGAGGEESLLWLSRASFNPRNRFRPTEGRDIAGMYCFDAPRSQLATPTSSLRDSHSRALPCAPHRTALVVNVRSCDAD
mmetsp:Transcript_45008/g.137460  ORF Transcript_45008/g.137460 Transcript_45008/m.137460 type:complete len:182 (-) Transcript_45008:197-742(-)